MDQVIEQVIVVLQDELNEDLAATQAAFFNADGTPFSFGEGGPGGGVSEAFVNDAIATALAGLPEDISEEFVTDAIATAISGLPVGRTEEQVQAAIEDAIIDLTGTAYVNDAIATAVGGLASEAFVTSLTGEAVTNVAAYIDSATADLASETYVDTAVDGLAAESFVTSSLATAVSGLLGSADGSSDTLGELATLIAARITSGLVDAKGDLITATADNTPVRKAAGSDGSVLKAKSSETDGLLWGWAESALEHYTKPTGSWQTFPRQMGLADQAVLGSGRNTLTAIYLPKGQVVTNIAFFCLATPSGTPTHGWFFLTDSAYVQLRATADFTNEAWLANTKKIKALSSTFTTTYEGLYYIGLNIVASTPPTLACASQNSAGVNSELPLISLHGLTGQTAPSADGTNLAPSPANQSQMAWAYVT